MRTTTTISSKILYIINLIFAVLLLFWLVLPYFSPKTVPLFAVFSLFLPIIILTNLLFLIYWVYNYKKQFILPTVVLLISFLFLSPIYKLSSDLELKEDNLSIMSYNIRMFNIYKHIKKDNISEKIISFVNTKKPAVIAFQEFDNSYLTKLNFKDSYFVSKSKNGKFGLALFSNYKIINKGSLNFKNSSNNAIYIDIVKNKDTIRIYNVHLQSLGINPFKQNFVEKQTTSLLTSLKESFSKQAIQTTMILKNQAKFSGKKIICGDFNNTAYSWVYRKLLEGKKDAFLELGNGFGKTLNYYMPLRIDFLLIDQALKITSFKTFAKDYSDHEPILCHINTK